MALFSAPAVAVGMLATHTITIRRPAATTYAAGGFASTQTFVDTTARGAVQPSSGADLKRGPEGLRSGNVETIYSTTELRVKDRVIVTGKGTYQIEHVFDQSAAGGFWKALARKLDPNEPRA